MRKVADTHAKATVDLPRLGPTVPRSGVSDAARLALRQLLGDTDRRITDAYHAGIPALELADARGSAIENIVAHVWTACIGESRAIALYAVGGFGRGAMFPFSDVDLLVLCESAPRGSTVRALESFFVLLWDLGLKPGHALRTLTECRELAAQDATIYTSLLDGRRIAGAASLDAGLAALLADAAVWPLPSYLAAKRADRMQRHARFGDTTYNLEPNLKDGPGGLRDAQTMLWLGRRLFDAPTFAALAQRNLISPAEAATLEHSIGLLGRIRFALHLAAGRAEERLLFDYQRELARQFGFSDEHRRNLGVEQFMQDFYRAAITIERLSEQFLQRCEEALEEGASGKPLRLNVDFVSIGGRLDCDPPDLLLHRPAALIDLFRIWVEHPEIASPRADLVRRIHEALDAVGADLPFDDEVNAAFAKLLRRGAPAVEALARMNHYGVLAQYLPAFGRVVGRMQYDLFHAYTVDEHTMRVLRIAARFASAETSREFAHAHELWSRLVKPELLLLAALFHDIAKGRGGDHSELGAVEAREFCTRLRLSASDTDLVAWLVRWHLLMSVTAQRQDITNPDVVHRFAVSVGDWERLDYLYLLTCADISGTSAKLWNSWKDRLLADLYVSARYMLRGGLDRPPHAAERVADVQLQARGLLRERFDDSDVDRVWSDFPDEYFLRFTPQQIAWQTEGIALDTTAAPLVLVEAEGLRGGTEVFVYAPDRDGLFATITAVLDRLSLSVQDARVVNSRSGMSLDTFLVLDGQGRALRDPAQVGRLQRGLTEALDQSAEAVAPIRRPPPRVLRHFPIPTRIEFHDDAASNRTQLALVCADRPGLLAGVADVFRAGNIRVHDARIATFGERVEDFFLITDQSNRPLDSPAREVLREALERCVNATAPASPEGIYVIA
jgi:[protein-PII] uridylyltransferase